MRSATRLSILSNDPFDAGPSVGPNSMPSNDSQMPPQVSEEGLPHARSRSASVLSLSAAPEDDISAIMMRGASDLRNVKYENDEQVKPFYQLNDLWD